MEVIIEAVDPIEVKTVVGNHTEDPNKGEGDNKTIIGANTKATAEAIIITMAIIKAELETISDTSCHY